MVVDFGRVRSEQELVAAVRPRDVGAAAGDWLGNALSPNGFQWVPRRRTLERRAGGLLHQIHLQASRHNRAGQLIKVGTTLNVRDPAVRDWRRAHPRLVVGDDDFVCGHLLGYASGRAGEYRYGDATDGDIDLTEPGARRQRLVAFTAMVRQSVLPWFDEASDPDLVVASQAADYTSSPAALAEWLASRGRPDLIGAYARRYLARSPGAQPHYEAGREAAGCEDAAAAIRSGNPARDLGWSVATLTASDF